MEKEVPQLCIEKPRTPEKPEKADDVESFNDEKEVDSEEVTLIYQAPRMFRQSLIHKTQKLFRNENDKRVKPKMNRSLKENFCWLTIMLTGFLMAFLVTDRAWTKFQTNPTITSLILNDNSNSLAFPTISVCPDHAASVTKVDDLMKKLGIKTNDTSEVGELLRAIPNLSYGQKSLKAVILSDEISAEVNDLFGDDLRSLAFQLSIACSDVFNTCRFKGKSINCCASFLPIYTEHGFCYAFNSKIFATPLEDYYNSNMFVVDEADDKKLSFELKVPSKLFMNSVDESLYSEQRPLWSTKLGTTFEVLIGMHRTEASPKVHDLNMNQRKCVLENEVTLKRMKGEPYSYSSCMNDCQIDLTMQVCGCVPPFHRTKSLKNTTICDVERLKCMKANKISDIKRCRHCELPCDFTTFSVEKSSCMMLPNSEYALISIDFLHWPMLFFQREVRFGFVDFLVAFGSILALFLSFSILSAIEVLLYCFRFVAMKICPSSDA